MVQALLWAEECTWQRGSECKGFVVEINMGVGRTQRRPGKTPTLWAWWPKTDAVLILLPPTMGDPGMADWTLGGPCTDPPLLPGLCQGQSTGVLQICQPLNQLQGCQPPR
ncbi:uncharacterized protein LOC121830756 [Peromyscus maniculatus bairdii]|uniref:uncharacterized protein LOC121830756 n=1 Tax=Peromyscus maniculatus bairdii TaxID=230844 RepID=UPI003FD56845